MWTLENIARLKQRWADGASAGVIAAELGITRNAAIGKTRRLGLPQRVSRELVAHDYGGRPDRPKIKFRPVRQNVGGGAVEAINRKRAVPRAIQAPPLAAPTGGEFALHCGFLDLTNETCRYPFGDGAEMFFCGAASDNASGHPYCDQHEKLCWAGRRPISHEEFELRRIDGRKHAAAERLVA